MNLIKINIFAYNDIAIYFKTSKLRAADENTKYLHIGLYYYIFASLRFSKGEEKTKEQLTLLSEEW